MALSGTATDDILVTSVTWVNDRGGSGTATGTDNWSVADCNLFEGTNVITVTAHDGDSNTGTGVLTVIYDTVAPAIQITSPTSAATYSTTNSTLQLGGTSSDATSGIEGLFFYHTELDYFGPMTGFTTWTTVGLVLQLGTNTIVVSSFDKAGNTGTDTITITLTGVSDIGFPTTPILDTGVRANENPLSHGGDWVNKVFTSNFDLRIFSNHILSTGVPGDRCSAYWVGTTTHGMRDEVYGTIGSSQIDGISLYCRLVNPGTENVNGYEAQLFMSGSNVAYRYRRIDLGAATNLTSTLVGPTIVSGDSVGILMDGTILRLLVKQEPGDWVFVDAGVTDNTYPLGTGTIGLRLDADVLSLTNFGGGNGQAPATPTTGPMRSGAW